ncbi:hypothetical protein EDD86DRAFT_244374 [Gorgonomyces haynaldii]|nr:hypothetical protein EDD86DRAFT_244374 [Gorgonomyces haynaldii]
MVSIGASIFTALCLILLIFKDLRKGKLYAQFTSFSLGLQLIWNFFRLCFFLFDTEPWVCYTYTQLGLVCNTVYVIINGQILKAFSQLSTWITPKRVTRFQIGVILCNVVFGGGSYLRGIYMGRSPPSWMQAWSIAGYSTFIVVVNLYDLWQIYSLVKLSMIQIEAAKMVLAESNASSSTRAQAEERITGYDLLGYTHDPFYQMFGNSLATFAPFTSLFLLKEVQSMTRKKMIVSTIVTQVGSKNLLSKNGLKNELADGKEPETLQKATITKTDEPSSI